MFDVRSLALPDADAESRLVVALVAGSHFVNHTYLMLLPPLFAALEASWGVSTAQLGLAVGVQGAVVTLLQLPFGTLADTRSRELVLAVSLVAGTAGAALTAVAPNYPALVAAQVVVGVGVAGHHPAHYPLLGAATQETERGRAFSVHGFAGSLGFAAPFAVAGAAFALGQSWRVAVGALVVVGAAYTVGCLALVRTRVSEAVRRPDAETRAAHSGTPVTERARETLRTLSSSPGILLLTGVGLMTSTAGWGIRTYASALLTDGYGLSEALANPLVSAMLVVGAVSILFGGVLADRYPPASVLLGGFAALAVLSAVLAAQLLPVAVAALLVLPFSATVTVSRPSRSKLADSLSARGDLGRSFALITVGISLGAVVGPPVFGYVEDVAGTGPVFFAVAAVGVVAAALTVVVAREFPVDRPSPTPDAGD